MTEHSDAVSSAFNAGYDAMHTVIMDADVAYYDAVSDAFIAGARGRISPEMTSEEFRSALDAARDARRDA